METTTPTNPQRDALVLALVKLHPGVTFFDPQIDELLESNQALYQKALSRGTCNDLSWEDFIYLPDNVKALLTVPPLDGEPTNTFSIHYADENRFVFVHVESGMPVDLSLDEVKRFPDWLRISTLGEGGNGYIEQALSGEITPHDPVADQLKQMAEDQQRLQEYDHDLKIIASDILPAIDGGVLQDPDNVPPDTVADPKNEYMSFERYLETMRQMHNYIVMPNEHKAEFDRACAFRWRDLKALKLILASVEGKDGLNAYGRHKAELIRVTMLNDQAFLEINFLRNMLRQEITWLGKLADKSKKEKKSTQSAVLSTAANRLERHLNLLGELPPEAIDVLTRLQGIVQSQDAKLAEQEVLIRQLKEGFQEEADYCYAHAEKLSIADPERSARHRERGDRLAKRAAGLPAKTPKKQMEETVTNLMAFASMVNPELSLTVQTIANLPELPDEQTGEADIVVGAPTAEEAEPMSFQCEHPGCRADVAADEKYERIIVAGQINDWDDIPEFLCTTHAIGRVKSSL